MIQEIEKEYLKYKVPLTATIELTSKCNWRCKHCYLTDNTLELPENVIFELIDELREMGVYELKLSGGEPTIRSDLSDIIAYARKKYMSVILLTNMSFLSEELFAIIKKYGLQRVETTLFSMNPQIHDSFVGVPNAFSNTMDNLLRLKELNVDILVKTWAISSNINDLEKMKLYFESAGFGFSVFTQIYPDFNGIYKLPDGERISDIEYAKALEISDKTLRRNFPLEVCDNRYLCEEFRFRTYITVEGDVIPCAKF